MNTAQRVLFFIGIKSQPPKFYTLDSGGNMKRTVIELLIGLPIVVLGFFLLEFLYCTLITRTPFVFDIKSCGIAVAVWVVVVIVSHILRKRRGD